MNFYYKNLNKLSFSLLICYLHQNELVTIFNWYYLIIILTLPFNYVYYNTYSSLNLISSSFIQTILPSLTLLSFTYAAIDNKLNFNLLDKKLNNLTEIYLNQTYLISNSTLLKINNLKNDNKLNNESDNQLISSHYITKIDFSKESIFPCLDYLELNILNILNRSLDHNHLIRIYHSNELNQLNRSLIKLIKYSEDQLNYVKEFIINKQLVNNSKFYVYCNLFDPKYLVYCFRYVLINQKTSQIKFESDLNCLPTLEFNQNNLYFKEENLNNTELKEINLNKKVNLNRYDLTYGSSLKLFKIEEEEEEKENNNDKKLNFNLNKSKKLIQTKYIECSCGKKNSIELTNKTSYLIQLTSGNGFCNNKLLNNKRLTDNKINLKTLIKIRKLDFEFCFIDLTIPSWIELKVKDVLLIEKKDQDLKFTSSSSSYSNNLNNFNNLIIRDGQTYISPQLNYLNSFPTFHFISSGLLRFESKQLGNQYTIELNRLNIDLFRKELFLNNNNNQFERDDDSIEDKKENKIVKNKKLNFLNERIIKLNYTKNELLNESINENKFKLNQISQLKYISKSNRKLIKKTKSNDDLFVLLIDQNNQNLLIDNHLNLNKKINQFLDELDKGGANLSFNYQILDNNLKFINQLKTKTLIIYLLSIIFLSLISLSIGIFLYIYTKTKIKPPTGNLIRFGLENENFHLNNDYQEVQSSNYYNRSKLIKITDEEAIYESCRAKTSQDNSSDENDLLNNSDSETELQNELDKSNSSDDFSNTETLKNVSTVFKSSFKNEFHELQKKRKMFKNCLDNSKNDDASNAIGRLSQSSIPTSEISLELDWYDYIHNPFDPKTPNL